MTQKLLKKKRLFFLCDLLFALELWILPVADADCTISDLPIGKVEDTLSPRFPPFDSSNSGTCLAVFPNDSHWCFRILSPLPHMVSSNSSLTPLSLIPTHHYPYLPLLVHGEWGSRVFRETISEASQVPVASAATSAARVVKGGRSSVSLSCLSAFLLVCCLTSCWCVLAHPSSLSLYSCLRCSYPGSREGGFTDTHTLCMGEESGWVRGLEDISSILFPLSSTCGDLA